MDTLTCPENALPELRSLNLAQQALVVENQSLVYFVAKRYRHIPAQDYEDLCGRLVLRLCKSVIDWNPRLGYRLSSYVVKCLTGEAKNYFRDYIWVVKPPRRLRETSLSQLLDAVKGSPSEANIQGEDSARIRTCALPISIDTQGHGTDGQEDIIIDMVASDEDMEAEVVARIGENAIVREIAAALRPEEAEIMSYLLNKVDGESVDPQQLVQEGYQVSRADADAIIEEIREKMAYYYGHIQEGCTYRPSTGNDALRKALNRRWEPDVESTGNVRRRALTEDIVCPTR